jgi:hypothetical protein
MKELFHVQEYTGERVTGPHSDLFDTENIWGNCTWITGSAGNLTGDVSGVHGDVGGLCGNADGIRLITAGAYMYFGDITGLDNHVGVQVEMN